MGKLSGLQDSAARDGIELDIQLWRGVTLHGLEGLASHAASLAYELADALAVSLDRKPEQVLVKHGEVIVAMQSARIDRGELLAADALAVALTMPASALHAQSYGMLGLAVYWRGQLHLSLRHLEQSLALYEKYGRQYSNAEWANTEVSAHGFAAKSLRLLGQLDSATKRSENSINLARELAHPSSLAFALYADMVVLESRRDWVELRAQAQAEIALAEEYGFPLWRAWGHLFLGVAQCEAGEGAAGLQSIRDALAEFEAIDSQLLRPYCLALFAEANGKLGDPAAGLVALDEALERIERSDERHYEAEVHRLYGELLVQAASPAEKMAAGDRAEQCFTHAIEIARGQEAKLLELRAAMSLVRLWQSQRKFVEAHAVLAPIYGWFTEGFETRDLIESKTLLEGLASGR